MGSVKPAIFFDRDGVIIQNRDDYVRSWDDVEFIPGSITALNKLSSLPYHMVIVTNQSIVGRGIISLEAANNINTRVIEIIEREGGRIDAAYLCPHTPHDRCSCRKPEPGMIFQAEADLSIDLPTSYLIGDSYTDLLAGQAAGIKHLGLVRTGFGATHEPKIRNHGISSYQVFDNLKDALSMFPLKTGHQ